MKRLLSYIWPQTTKINTDHNGIMELTFFNGRKVLNSKNANYSFGPAQRIMETGLSKVELKNVSTLLLLGLGGGGVISLLRKNHDFKGKIVAVELDQKIIEIARDEFFISSSDNLIIENCDAYEFVNNCNSRFDLIIVDLFIDNKVPEKFYTEEFCHHLSRIMATRCSIIFNLGLYHIDEENRANVLAYFNNIKELSASHFEKVSGTNSLLIVNKIANSD